jgi:6-pyruvoyltetrahydropterin/6-carboxytetrahydropterin synthase
MKQRRVKRAAGSAPVLEISCAFGFDAAHRFKSAGRGHRYGRVHGHSFRAEVVVRGTPRQPHGFVMDFADLDGACRALRLKLDHALLNEVKGLQTPSLENLCLWIWKRLEAEFPGLSRVTVRRDSLGQSCTYRGLGTRD